MNNKLTTKYTEDIPVDQMTVTQLKDKVKEMQKLIDEKVSSNDLFPTESMKFVVYNSASTKVTEFDNLESAMFFIYWKLMKTDHMSVIQFHDDFDVVFKGNKENTIGEIITVIQVLLDRISFRELQCVRIVSVDKDDTILYQLVFESETMNSLDYIYKKKYAHLDSDLPAFILM